MRKGIKQTKKRVRLRLDLGARGLLFVMLLSAVVLVNAWLPISANAAVPCANEDLRSALGELFLPDCRAYEMVSPLYKEGYPIFVNGFAVTSQHALLLGLANLNSPGAGENVFKGAMYLDTRTSSGWSLSALNAPSSEFVGEIPLAAEPVSGETLWEQHTPLEPITKLGLYARSPGPTPSFRFIGPLNIPYEGEPTEPSNAIYVVGNQVTEAVGATEGYSHVVVLGPQGHWSFDATSFGQPSLYEYSGTGNAHPVLVGVKGENKGSTELVGLCGTLLGGGPFGSMYNSLSVNGEAIFFTAMPESSCGAKAPSSTEVYARLNGALIDPGRASTLDVSASQCSESCGEVSGKNFEGASEDGRRVFFTSTQKLTNNAVDATASGEAAKGQGCAKSQHCNLYEYEFILSGGRLEPGSLRLVAGGDVMGVAGIAEDGSRIYYVSNSKISSAGVNEFGAPPENGQPNLYVYDTATGKTSFVALLATSDEGDWKRALKTRTVEVGGEAGRYLLFESANKLTPDDTSSVNQLFEYDAATGELVRVSKGENGYNNDGNSVSTGIPLNLMANSNFQLGGLETDFKSSAPRLNMSSDGRTVVFETGGRLSARAISAEAEAPGNGPCKSLYEFHSNGSISEGSVSLISDGRDAQVVGGGACGAEFEGMDASGENMTFLSADPLVPSDKDGGQVDIYDARVDGGFAVGQEGHGCGIECEGASSVAPVSSEPASAGESGEAQQSSAIAPANKKIAHRVKKKRKGAKRRKRGRKAGLRRSLAVSRHGGGR